MMDFLRPWVGRVLAGWVATLAGYLNARYDIVIDAETQAGLVAVILGTTLSLYGPLHKLINAWINPVDAASVDSAARTVAKHEQGQL